MNIEDRIQKLENELALLMADIKVEQEPLICSQPAMLFEVYPSDLEKMNWDDAVKACTDLGEGWRLPTKDELNAMYEQLSIGGFADSYYWSSTEFDNYDAWLQFFGDGFHGNGSKYYSYHVRAVRDIKE